MAATSARNRPTVVREGIESSTTLGKQRWIIERTIAWLFCHTEDHRND
jgi:hypothetical protein